MTYEQWVVIRALLYTWVIVILILTGVSIGFLIARGV